MVGMSMQPPDQSLSRPSPEPATKLFSARNVETLASAGTQEAAIASQEGISQADIAAHATFKTVIASEAIFKEKACVIEIQRDGVFIADAVEILFVVSSNELKHGRDNALAIIRTGNQREPQINTRSR